MSAPSYIDRLAARAQDLTERPRLKKPIRVARMLWTDVDRADVFNYAGGMAYATLLSIVPSLAVTFAIISAFQPLADPNATWFESFRGFVLANLAPETGHQAVQWIERFLANLDVARIGITGVATLVVILVLLLRNVELALNEIWLVKTPRSLFKRFLFFWTVCTLGAFLLTLGLGALSQFDMSRLVPGGAAQSETPLLTFLGTLAVTYAFFVLLYKIGPNCHVAMRPALIGAAVATVLIRVASIGFGYYAAWSDWYRNVYGAVAAMPFVLLWLYLVWVITLLGAVVAWRAQQGFAVVTEKEDGGSALAPLTPEETERNVQLRGLMPLVCVLAVNDAFDAGRRGISGRRIAEDLDLPLNWVTEGLRGAVALGYVVSSAATAADVDDAPDEASAIYYPTTPPNAVTLADFVSDLTRETREFVRARKPKATHLGAERLVRALTRHMGAGDGRVSLSRLLQELRG